VIEQHPGSASRGVKLAQNLAVDGHPATGCYPDTERRRYAINGYPTLANPCLNFPA